MCYSGYLRQSLISSDAGKTNEATTWLTRALEVSNDQPDATICLGDLYLKSEHAVDAKKCYDKICATVDTATPHDVLICLLLFVYLHRVVTMLVPCCLWATTTTLVDPSLILV